MAKNNGIKLSSSFFSQLGFNGLDFSKQEPLHIIKKNASSEFSDKNYTFEQIQAYHQLLISREIFIEVFKSIQEGIQIIDSKGIIVYVNPAFLKIIGVQASDRIGKNIMDVSPDGSLAAVMRTEKKINYLKNSPIGTTTELVSSATPIYINNQFVGAVAIMRDVKELKILSDKLDISEKMINSLSEKIGQLSKAKYSLEDIIAVSDSMKQVIDIAQIAAQNDAGVLILGETGTGKEIIANAIHKSSLRSKKPFISVNCSAISSNLLESEFFGHEKGAFTGAYKRQIGKFELANSGTLLLDEIGDMDVNLQAKILRAIQEQEIQRVGGEKSIPIDVRIIAATNRDLEKMMDEGLFRRDLYYRLNVLNITIPPLRDRIADIDALVEYLSEKICKKLGKPKVSLNKDAKEVLNNYDWPGNVRELENILERAILYTDGIIITSDSLSCINRNKINTITSSIGISRFAEMEKSMIEMAIDRYGNSYKAKKEISHALGISLASLYNKINKYKISY